MTDLHQSPVLAAVRRVGLDAVDADITGNPAATGELVQELHADSDPVVREVIGSYAKYRNLMAEYAPYAFAGEMNARTQPFAEG